ncbi:DEKNAAC105277 [Brettanomyces naardenensis]|uniref:DEKNAAC105277 n=1 Tax=Brettanomyces naardenensis TaxID=13370 RepID=A0A448YSU0_BRENA|nr:DEKNAAC105277 [Brettanomyces naardenensis]
MSRQHFNELNQKAWNKDSVGKFENPEFIALSRLSVLKYLSIDGTHSPSEYRLADVNSAKPKDINNDIWSKTPLKILDFACGAGNVSLALIDLLPNDFTITGLDISNDIVEVYNEKIPSKYGHALGLDLMADDFGGFKEKDFDIAVCTMSLHHIPDIGLLAERIAGTLKVGGWFLVMDFDGHSPHTEQDAKEKGIAHHSLNAEMISKCFTEAGLGKVIVERGFKYVFGGADPSWPHGSGHEGKNASEHGNDHHIHLENLTLCVVAGQKTRDDYHVI